MATKCIGREEEEEHDDVHVVKTLEELCIEAKETKRYDTLIRACEDEELIRAVRVFSSIYFLFKMIDIL